MTNKVLLLNGPNLNLMGERQPDIYGKTTLENIVASCQKLATSLGLEVQAKQSNYEGQLIEWIQEARHSAQAIIINPGAFTHTSIAILDALIDFEGLVIEVHISNIHRREQFRRKSYVSERADGLIAGLGTNGYELAITHLATALKKS